MSSFESVGRFETVIEAEELRIRLESIGIEAFVETSHIGSIMPYATNAMGGVTVKVKEEDFQNALAILAEMKNEPSDAAAPNIADQADGWIKRAGYAAMIGSFLLPVISNFWSYYLYVKAKRMDPESVRRHRALVIVGVAFNSFMLIVWIVLAILYFKNVH